jgi:outer membrane receptor for ferrienterochelin and colicins
MVSTIVCILNFFFFSIKKLNRCCNKRKDFIFILLVIIPYLAYSQEHEKIEAEDILSMSLEEMLNVEVVSASKTPQKLKEVPATVRIITANQIKERGYFVLEDVLADLPGFNFRNIVGFNSYSFIRGLPNQNNLILLLIDGVQVNELNSGGYYGGGQYNLSNVDHIEVLYGPASALYGTNAISGIIDIITKKPEGKGNSYIGGSVGNFATTNVDFACDYLNKQKDIGLRVSGMYKKSEKADLGGEKGDYNWTENMENFEDDISFDGYLSYNKLSAGMNYLNKRSSRTTNYKSIDDQYDDRGTLWNIHFMNGYIQYLYDQKENWKNKTKLYYRNTTVMNNTISYIVKENDSLPGYQVGYFRPNFLVGIENQGTYQISQNISLIGGIAYEHEQLADDFSKTFSSSQYEKPPIPRKPDMIDNNLFSAYIQSQFIIRKWLLLTAGLRQDISSYYGNVTTPRLALISNFNKYTLKFLYNEAFRAPKPWDYTSGIGNDNLDPEKIRSGEFNISYMISPSLNIETFLYRNTIREIFIREYLDGDDWRWINKDKIHTNGVEFDLIFLKDKFSSYVNYTFNDSHDQNGNPIAEISKHSANAGTTIKILPDLLFHLRCNYLGKRENPKVIQSTGANIIDDAFIFHSNISFLNFHHFDIHFTVNNLLNAKYFHTSNLSPDRFRQPQRRIRVKLNYSF